MIRRRDPKICPICRGQLKFYDHVPRVIRSESGKIEHVKIRRFRCVECKKMHRELPDNLMPYKQFRADIIAGIVDGSIEVQDLEFEDYPCEMTMKRWLDEYGRATKN